MLHIITEGTEKNSELLQLARMLYQNYIVEALKIPNQAIDGDIPELLLVSLARFLYYHCVWLLKFELRLELLNVVRF